MGVSKRLEDLHEILEEMVEKNLDEDGNIRTDDKLRNLISIYRDILNIDSDKIPKDDWTEISEALHHHYVVNGSFSFNKTGPDTYSVYLFGGYKDEGSKRKMVQFDLKIIMGQAVVTGYRISQTSKR